MENKTICDLHIVMTKVDDARSIEVNTEFHGTPVDKAFVLGSVLRALQLTDDPEGHLLCAMALHVASATEEDGVHVESKDA